MACRANARAKAHAPEEGRRSLRPGYVPAMEGPSMPALRNSEPPSLVNPRSNVSTLSRAPSFKSASYVRALADAERFARDNDATILIEGESGTGKTQLARHLHTVSPRATGPFHGCALTGVQDSLAESDLFGHAMGAFTGAKQRRAGMFVTASGGTLFLDEIGKASHRVQQLLLDSVPVQRECDSGGGALMQYRRRFG